MTTFESSPEAMPPPGEPPPGDRPPEKPQPLLPWIGVPAWSTLVAVLVLIAGGILVAVLIGAILGLAGVTDDPDEIDGATVALNVSFDAMFILAPVVVVMWLTHRRPDPAAFGLRIPNWRSALGWSVLIYLGVVVVAGIIIALLGEPKTQAVSRELKTEDSVALLVAIGFMTGVAAPLGEEFFFRGFLFRVLWERTNVSIGTFATGVVFGLAHAGDTDIAGVLLLAALGAGLCVLLWRTASLLPCIMLHSFHNSISFADTKGLPWWGFLLLTAASVLSALAIAVLAMRAFRPVRPSPVPA
ncbi:MAG TPA: CPBP family intramembrane glutamic endopeptidase [Solirubrobacteraceae bacterium]|nr:CPBP family intramembrane glutamic endopeptidase [Solirubrobacteraceae bacterium]